MNWFGILRKLTRIERKPKTDNVATKENPTHREFISFQFPCSNLTSTNNVSPHSTQKHLLVSTRRDTAIFFAKNEHSSDSFSIKTGWLMVEKAWENASFVFNRSCKHLHGKNLFHLESRLAKMLIKFFVDSYISLRASWLCVFCCLCRGRVL